MSKCPTDRLFRAHQAVSGPHRRTLAVTLAMDGASRVSVVAMFCSAKSLSTVCLCLLLLYGCATPKTWTAEELRAWYTHSAQDNGRFLNPLYYRGSDADYHYFSCRSMDTWVSAKVRRDDIALLEERAYPGASNGPFPGYYAVDPNAEFVRMRQ